MRDAEDQDAQEKARLASRERSKRYRERLKGVTAVLSPKAATEAFHSPPSQSSEWTPTPPTAPAVKPPYKLKDIRYPPPGWKFDPTASSNGAPVFTTTPEKPYLHLLDYEEQAADPRHYWAVEWYQNPRHRDFYDKRLAEDRARLAAEGHT